MTPTTRIFTDPAHVRLLALDVDGVLTDGSILLDDDGREIKRFNIRDGLGLRVWTRLGFGAAVVTGRCGRSVQHRMAELGVGEVIQGSKDKAESLALLETRTNIPREHMAFLGDDWPDLAIMSRVGYPMAVGDADRRIIEKAAFVTRSLGGRGAVREAVEHLLAAKGMMDRAVGLYDA
ncbi:MAG: HAD hydrolase family protein [Phycisphaeraceae bacterium]|nr:HAD hydrolase family protein [Phycisphaeraceae bacterium]